VPLPAGYKLDSDSPNLPKGYTLDQEYSPSPANPGENSSLTADFLKNSPAGMVKGLADAIRSDVQNPKETGSGIVQMMKSNATLWDKAKASFKNGDYVGAAAHFLNYLIPGGKALDEAGEDFQRGDVAHGTAKTLGIASNVLAPEIPRAVGAIADAAPAAGTAVRGAARGAVDAATDTAHFRGLNIPGGNVMAGAVGGSAAARAVGLPGELGAVVGGAAPIVKGAIRGAKTALADRLAAAAETAAAESADPILNALATLRTKGGKFSDLNTAEQAQVRDLAERFRQAGSTKPPGQELVPGPKQVEPRTIDAKAEPVPAPAAQPPQPAAQPDIVSEISAPAPAENPAADLDAIAQAGIFGKKYKNFASAPAEAQATIRGVVQGMKAQTAPAAKTEPTGPEGPTSGSSPSNEVQKAEVIEIPRSEVSRETSHTSEQSPTEMFRALPSEAARAEFLRQREAGTSANRAIADGMYAQGKNTPAESAQVYEAAARADKAEKLAQSLYQHGVTHAELAPHQASELVKLLTPASKALGIKPPSTTTIGEVLFRLQRLEAAKAKLPGAK